MNEKIIKKLLGLRIKQLRKSKKLTQFALGELIDIDQRQIAHIEGGNSFPSLKTLNKFSKIFECKLKDIFDYEHLLENVDMKSQINDKLSKMDYDAINMCYQLVNIISNYKIMK